jgi:anthranilate synthase component 1
MTAGLEFRRRALAEGRAVPVVRWVLADTETPVTAFAKLRALGACALLESVEGGERWGRLSVIGLTPRRQLRLHRDGSLQRDDDVPVPTDDLFGELRRVLNETHLAVPDGEDLPAMLGGWVSFFGWGLVHRIEPSVPDAKPETMPFPEAVLLEFDRLVLFDNVRHAMAVVAVVHPDAARSPADLLDEGARSVDEVIAALQAPHGLAATPPPGDGVEFRAMQDKADFEAGVEAAREAILAGDAIQVVLSQRFEAPLRHAPLDVYRALRIVNPSPYLFFLELPEGTLIGSSPEVLVRLDGSRATVRPIAGTRRRGASPEADRDLELELLADPKEIAEHVMLVDLGRNDLGRVCSPGSVRVTEQMVIERYSHVMHIVSNVQGHLRPGSDAIDLLRATFPAGTVSGAPKVRAMQLIEEIEPIRRGPYAGSVGWFDYRGDCNTCITIRTLYAHGDRLTVHVGAGIVADSVPALEHEECLNKARGMFEAVRLLERGFDWGRG